MRSRRNRDINDLHWDGTSLFWPQTHEVGPPGGDSNLWMCAQDAGQRLWGYFHSLRREFSEGDSERLRLEDCSDELQCLLIESLPYNDYQDDLCGALVDFAQLVAQTLVLEGRMTFEIKVGWDHKAKPRRAEAATITYLPPRSFLKLGSRSFQIVPPGVDFERPEGRIMALDTERIIQFLPPRQWRRPLARIRRILPVIGRSERAWMNRVARQLTREDFDTVKRSYRVKIARLTGPIGWNGRGLFHDEIADFHFMTRELRWHRFCIELRDGILRTLREVFHRIGQLRHEKPNLVWEHLPTVELVTEGLRQMRGSGARFDTMMKPFH